ncbi:MAG: glycoside hydrolase family 65 protein, partial [Actinomycetia bacterium]|nr:glycoside hydrolase family 65 protein [Actinomycetes bacterium]
MNHQAPPTGLPTHRFPVDPWRLVETEYCDDDLGHTETLFALGNGYLGMRANPEEGRNAHSHGTYLNGFHETWEIQHAEDAYGFAKTGQTIVNAPDSKLMKLYVDDEPILLETADLPEYERSIDFRTGVLKRHLLWRTPSGRRVRVSSTRMVSFVHRHLAMMTIEVTPLDGAAPIVISSQLMNRQDGADEYHVRSAALGEGKDPRRARKFTERVLEPQFARREEGSVILGYRCRNSGMTLAAGYWNQVEARCETRIETTLHDDLANTVVSAHPEAGETVRLTKFVSYHTSRGVPAEELADRCARTLARSTEEGPERLLEEQADWLTRYWERADIQLQGDDSIQQALRWNLFQLAQASARTHAQGVAAKGVTAGGYDGHYFWDTEVYVVPFLAYTDPEAARKMIRFRWKMLDAGRRRARMLN